MLLRTTAVRAALSRGFTVRLESIVTSRRASREWPIGMTGRYTVAFNRLLGNKVNLHALTLRFGIAEPAAGRSAQSTRLTESGCAALAPGALVRPLAP